MRLTLLSSAEQGAVVFEGKVDVDELSSCEELHDHARGDDRGDTELHEGTPVGGEDSSEPVERVGRVGRHDTVKGHLGADEEDEQGGGCPQDFLVECDLRGGRCVSAWSRTVHYASALTFRSGAVTSGRIDMNGRTSSRKRTGC
jgi:hypothetical protein